MKQSDPTETGKLLAQAKRQQSACASAAAYDGLKGLLFDQAIAGHKGDRANLDTLADYSVVRMERPVVKGWDPSLDITRCKGRFILEIPPGAERAFGGERRLQADIAYTAQAAADGNGFVYQQQGAEPIVARLAAFDLASGSYQPPPAIDAQPGGAQAPQPTLMAKADLPPKLQVEETPRPAPTARPRLAPIRAAPTAPARPMSPAPRQVSGSERVASVEAREPLPAAERAGSGESGSGESVVRAFYGALGAGNGSAASARVIPEKRSSQAYSPEGISRFYGRLREPLRLTRVVPVAGGGYRVSYGYSTGRSRCNGSAIVRLSNRGGREFIRSIQALSGC